MFQPPNLISNQRQADTILTLRKNQTKEMLNTLSIMSTHEANECKTCTDASTQALRTYYQQEGAAQYNLNEALHVLVTLTNRSQKTVHSEQQKKRFLELSNKPTLALYMGFPDQLIPSDIKNQRLQPFLPPPRERSQSRPSQGAKKSENKLPNNQKETQSGLQGTPNEEGQPQCTKNKKDT